jgi:hypothetical protein
MNNNNDINAPSVYQIRVKGVLDPKWSSWFEGFTIEGEMDNTLITGKFADQAALRGALNKLWDLNLDLISVNQINKSNLNNLQAEVES